MEIKAQLVLILKDYIYSMKSCQLPLSKTKFSLVLAFLCWLILVGMELTNLILKISKLEKTKGAVGLTDVIVELISLISAIKKIHLIVIGITLPLEFVPISLWKMTNAPLFKLMIMLTVIETLTMTILKRLKNGLAKLEGPHQDVWHLTSLRMDTNQKDLS